MLCIDTASIMHGQSVYGGNNGSMAALHKAITDAELEVLKLLWGRGPLTAREITQEIYGMPSTSNIGTVQKLIQRLEQKGCVKRDRSKYVHRFSAKLSQAAVAGGQLEVLAAKISDGSLAPFLTHLVKARRLTREQKEEIRRMLEE